MGVTVCPSAFSIDLHDEIIKFGDLFLSISESVFAVFDFELMLENDLLKLYILSMQFFV